MPFAGPTFEGLRNHVGVEILQREGAILGAVRPIKKHWECLLQCNAAKRIIKSSTTARHEMRHFVKFFDHLLLFIFILLLWLLCKQQDSSWLVVVWCWQVKKHRPSADRSSLAYRLLSPVHTSNNWRNVRLCRKYEISTQNSFDIVAKNGNIVEATFDIVAFDNVASTLLLVWTGL